MTALRLARRILELLVAALATAGLAALALLLAMFVAPAAVLIVAAVLLLWLAAASIERARGR